MKERTTEIRILDEPTRRQLEMFELVFLFRYANSLIPDVFRCMLHLVEYMRKEDLETEDGQLKVARKAMLRFLGIFSGCTVEIPSPEDISRCSRDVQIYLSIKDPKHSEEVMANLAAKYSLSVRSVEDIYNQVQETLKLSKKTRGRRARAKGKEEADIR
jgi:Mor family transcriptional regulator